MNLNRIELLEQLHRTIRAGVEDVREANAARRQGQASFMVQAEIKERVDGAWVEILRLLDELETAPVEVE